MKCRICNHLCKDVTKHSFHAHNITSKKYYDLFYKNTNDGTCKICNKNTRYKSLIKGYNTYCSDICSSKDPKKNNRISKTVSSKDCQSQTKNTNLKKYGREYVLQLSDTKQKSKNTNLKRYGTIYPLQSDIIKKKLKNACICKYGCENVGQNENVKKKIKSTCIKKYGVTSHLLDPAVREKIKMYNLKKYGVEYKFQSDEFRKSAMYNGRYKLKYHILKSGNPIHYQTKIELQFIKYCENNNINIKNGDAIPYHFQDKNRIYLCDFKIKEKKKWRLIEIKQKHKWWYNELSTGKMKEKVKAAIKFSKMHNYLPYKIMFKIPLYDK